MTLYVSHLIAGLKNRQRGCQNYHAYTSASFLGGERRKETEKERNKSVFLKIYFTSFPPPPFPPPYDCWSQPACFFWHGTSRTQQLFINPSALKTLLWPAQVIKSLSKQFALFRKEKKMHLSLHSLNPIKFRLLSFHLALLVGILGRAAASGVMRGGGWDGHPR